MSNPSPNCAKCSRLVDYRRENKKSYPDYFNAPAPTFGPANASLLIVGLAPGLHGANRTGRPFTGDQSGELLFDVMQEFGLTNNKYAGHATDGFRLRRTAITNAVRCAPPQNKPNASEINLCRQFLAGQITAMKKLRAILCLGRIAHDSTIRALQLRPKDAPFGHGARHSTNRAHVTLFDSYHCSRDNTNTGRLTRKMLADVFREIESCIDKMIKP